jgi:hypothetical protein
MKRKKNNKSAQPRVAVVLAEMVKAIDDYMNVAPLRIIDFDQANVGRYVFHTQVPFRFSQFESWQERWMGVLYPRTLENQQKIHDYDEADEAERKNKTPKDDILAAHIQLGDDTRRYEFFFGYLMGLRAMGASQEQMLAKAKGFILTH